MPACAMSNDSHPQSPLRFSFRHHPKFLSWRGQLHKKKHTFYNNKKLQRKKTCFYNEKTSSMITGARKVKAIRTWLAFGTAKPVGPWLALYSEPSFLVRIIIHQRLPLLLFSPQASLFIPL
jgi:hypothetical protein